MNKALMIFVCTFIFQGLFSDPIDYINRFDNDFGDNYCQYRVIEKTNVYNNLQELSGTVEKNTVLTYPNTQIVMLDDFNSVIGYNDYWISTSNIILDGSDYLPKYLVSNIWIPEWYKQVITVNQEQALAVLIKYIPGVINYDSVPGYNKEKWNEVSFCTFPNGITFSNLNMIVRTFGLSEGFELLITKIEKDSDNVYNIIARANCDFDWESINNTTIDMINFPKAKNSIKLTFQCSEKVVTVSNTESGEIIYNLFPVSKEWTEELYLFLSTGRINKTLNEVFLHYVSLDKLMSASDNLRLRSGEEASSSIITTMLKGTSVKIVKLGKQQTIDGITSNWVQVEVQSGKDRDGKSLKEGTIGWCFGGYLE